MGQGILQGNGGGGLTKKQLWSGSTTGTISVDTSDYELIGISTVHNGAAQETILTKSSRWQVIGTNYTNTDESSGAVAKNVKINSNSIQQSSSYWVLNGNSISDPITAVYGYK